MMPDCSKMHKNPQLTLNGHDNLGSVGCGQHQVGHLAPERGIVVVGGGHKAQPVARLGAVGVVRVVDPAAVLVPDDGGEGVAAVGLAVQGDGLAHLDGLALHVAQDLRPLRRI